MACSRARSSSSWRRSTALETLRKKLEDAIDHVLGIRVKVQLVAPRTIARSEGKAKRVLDKRNI